MKPALAAGVQFEMFKIQDQFRGGAGAFYARLFVHRGPVLDASHKALAALAAG